MSKLTCNRQRLERGLSLVELLTSVIIIGIATAGTMELAYVNAFWAADGANKADNFYAARRFLDTLNRDLRNAYGVSLSTDTGSPAPGTILTISRCPDLTLVSGFPIGAYPGPSTYVSYEVTKSDPTASDYIIQRSESNSLPIQGSGVTVLSGLVGPIDPSLATPLVFQFSPTNSGSNDGLGAVITEIPNSVVVNLELKRVSFDRATTAMNVNTNHSFEALRSEIFLRNSPKFGN